MPSDSVSLNNAIRTQTSSNVQQSKQGDLFRKTASALNSAGRKIETSGAPRTIATRPANQPLGRFMLTDPRESTAMPRSMTAAPQDAVKHLHRLANFHHVLPSPQALAQLVQAARSRPITHAPVPSKDYLELLERMHANAVQETSDAICLEAWKNSHPAIDEAEAPLDTRAVTQISLPAPQNSRVQMTYNVIANDATLHLPKRTRADVSLGTITPEEAHGLLERMTDPYELDPAHLDETRANGPEGRGLGAWALYNALHGPDGYPSLPEGRGPSL